MFFDDEDADTMDRLYIFMRNTKKMFETKLFGNHEKGDFLVYLNDAQKGFFRRELKIESSPKSMPFDFDTFFHRLNGCIPSAIALHSKIATIRQAWGEIDGSLLGGIVAEHEKTEFDRFIKLPEGQKPREKTLRKLYLFWNVKPRDIERLVADLKRDRKTVAWTTP